MKRETRIVELGPHARRIERADGQVAFHDLASGRFIELRPTRAPQALAARAAPQPRLTRR